MNFRMQANQTAQTLVYIFTLPFNQRFCFKNYIFLIIKKQNLESHVPHYLTNVQDTNS